MKASIAAVLIAALFPLSAVAQTAPPPEPYRPGLGDLMTMTVQPRHIKLAFHLLPISSCNRGRERWASLSHHVTSKGAEP